ncbi:MAG: hypothetical protein KDB52_03620 [Solirubrobacterales bacterium]|nr:hypothetical protein [Solirubrobacterales bacterium]
MKVRAGKFVVAFIAAIGVLTGGAALPAASAAPGDLDISFGTSGGYTATDGGISTLKSGGFWPMLTFGDGSYISAYGSVLSRRNADGTPDTGYGQGGFLYLPPHDRRTTYVSGMSLQGDSTIVLSNGTEGNQGTIYLERRDSGTGAIDPAFGTGGLVRLTTGQLLSEFDGPMWTEGLDIDASGRIYLLLHQSEALADGFVVRLTADGAVDKTFGDEGTLDFYSGTCGYPTGLTARPEGVYVVSQQCVKRFSLDGSPDPSFQQTPLNERQNLRGIMDEPGPGLLVEGYDAPNPGLSVWKLNPDGSLDGSFGTNGKLTTFDPNVQYWGLDRDSEGRFYATGDTNFSPGHYVVARFTATGERDLGFGTNGKVQTPQDPANPNGTLYRVVDGPAGLLVYGDAEFVVGSRVFSMRLLDDDTYDPDWGEGGKYWFSTLAPRSDRINDIARTADGKTLATGASGDQPIVVRYLANGKLDQSFGDQGQVRIESLSQFGDSGEKIAVTGTGDAVVCVTGQGMGSVLRIDDDGQTVSGFGDGGRFRESDIFGKRSYFNRCGGISAAPKGRILVGVSLYNGSPAVFRLKANGSVDPAFGKDGITKLKTDNPDYLSPVTFSGMKDGRSLIASPSSLVRLRTDGKRDPKFASRGVFDLTPGSRKILPKPRAIAVSSKGAVFVGGSDDENMILVKLDKSGHPSRRFGKQGVLGIEHPKFTTQINDIAFRPDGRVLLAVTGAQDCWNFSDCKDNLLVYQLADRGRPDRTFGRNGLVNRLIGVNTRANSLELTGRGIVVGGFTESETTSEDLLLLRLKR